MALIAKFYLEDEVVANLTSVVEFIGIGAWHSVFQDAHLAMEAMREAMPLVQELSEFCRLKSLAEDEKESK